MVLTTTTNLAALLLRWILFFSAHNHHNNVLNVHAFSLEPRLAIVKRGVPGSYFGFSVAEHQIIDHNKIDSTVLVGAPLDGLDGDGQIWRCPFTARADDCVPVDVEQNFWGGTGRRGNRREGRREDREGRVRGERNGTAETGEWMGTVVHSQGPGKIGLIFIIAYCYSLMIYNKCNTD